MRQKEIAEALGVSQGLVSMVLNGRKRLSPKMAEKAGVVFEKDPGIFVFGTLEEIRDAFNYPLKERGRKIA